MIPITKNVIVVDEQGNEYEATYAKRAKGLVKKGRARFVDDSKICLACPPNINLEDNSMVNNNGEVKQPIEAIEPAKNLVNKTKMETATKDEKLSMKYVQEQIEKITTQTEYLNNAIEKLGAMDDGESGEAYSPGNKMGQAKAQALGDVVRCRETTNQQLLKFFEKMYDDLKVQCSPKSNIVSKFDELTNWLKTVNWDELPTGGRTVIENAITAQLTRHW